MPTLLEKIRASAAERLELPANRQPAQELARYRRFLKVETHRLKIQHRAGASGAEVCRARSMMLDELLGGIVTSVIATSPGIPGHKVAGFSLVAIGGYGRGELNPFSDIDILFLHDGNLVTRGKPTAEMTALVDGLLYTLWDVGLKVGHSVRSVADCVEVANQDMQSKTSLIEARLILGSEKLFKEMQRAIVAKCVSGHEAEYLAARIEDQTTRRAKHGNYPMMQEPNIKNGCGGLRDFQNLVWMAFFRIRTRSLEALEAKDMITAAERKQLESAYDFLLRARNELHYTLGRSSDVLLRGFQPAVASGLGYADRSPEKRLEVFMRDYYLAVRSVDLITRTLEQRLVTSLPEEGLLPKVRSMLEQRRRAQREQRVDGFKFFDGAIYPDSNRVFKEQPRRMMRAFLHAQTRGLRLSADLSRLIRADLSLVDRSFKADKHVRETFIEILSHRGNVAPILRAMHEVGFLGKFMPEFGLLTCLVQHEFYHQYAADEHTLVCLGKLDHVWEAKEPPFSNYRDIFMGVERPWLLYLALLLHDSGKAYRSGKHEIIGGELAIKVGKRLGLDGATTHQLRLIIELHLLLVQVSQRRDLDDPTVIRHVAEQVQSADTLDMLTLHTLADSTGTSDQLWNSFKDSLLWGLYSRTRQLLVEGTEFIRGEERQRELLLAEIRRQKPKTFHAEEVEAHFRSLPPRYFTIHSAREIMSHLTLVHRFLHQQVDDTDEALTPVVNWHNEPDRGYTEVVVCTWDRAGLFSKICGALAASGFNILGAEIFSRTDGVVLDEFYVTDVRTGLLAKREEKERFEDLLTRALAEDGVDLHDVIMKGKLPRSPYRKHAIERMETKIEFDNDTAGSRTIIDIETEDRIRLLYFISQTLNELNLDVSLAKICTEKGAAIDSFYVSEADGRKIESPERQAEIVKKLKARIAKLGA
jgi:[protein-PII] uridylyltransferase